MQTKFLPRHAAFLAAALVVFGACKDSTGVPELNSISTEAIAAGLDRGSVSLLFTGLLDRDRGSVDQRYLVFGSTMARDIYRLDSAEPRYVTEILVAAPDAGGFVGGSAFALFFNAIRTANLLIDGLPSTQRAELSAQAKLSNGEILGVRGVARTIKAQAFYRALEMRDTLGLPIDVGGEIGSALAPFRCKPNVLAYIAALLDSAATDLGTTGAGGAAFYVALPAGFTAANAGINLSTPAGFLRYNRALKAKVELYRGLAGDATAYARALTALSNAYMDTTITASLNNGPVFTYSAAAGETTNPTFDNNIFANPKALDSLKARDTTDTRKAKFTSGTSTRYGFTGTPRLAETATGTATNQVRNRRILSNEELILIRAQIAIEQNDLVTANAYMSAVHRRYTAIPLVLATTKAQAITQVLFEKRYSLFFESAQRLVDLRAYNRFNATWIKPEVSTIAPTTADPFVNVLPIPKAELDQRGGTAPKTCS